MSSLPRPPVSKLTRASRWLREFASNALVVAMACAVGAVLGALLYLLPYAFGMTWHLDRFLALTGVGAGCGGALLLIVSWFSSAIYADEYARQTYAYVLIMAGVIAAVIGLAR